MGADQLFRMKVISAYMLAVTGGNDSPNVADCKKILKSVGIELSGDEEKRLEDLVEEMAGSGLAVALEKGHALLKTVPGGSGGGGGGALPLLRAVRAVMPLRPRSPPAMTTMPPPWPAVVSSVTTAVMTIKQLRFPSLL